MLLFVIVLSRYTELQSRILQAKNLRFPDSQAVEFEVETANVCRKNRVQFLDTEYPPTVASLYLTNHDLRGTPNLQDAWKDREDLLVWRRPSEFMAEDYAVFVDGITPSDIRQGCLTDCWFLCALAALAEHPVLIEELFVPASRVESSLGMYSMRMCHAGQWHTVTVDDHFPCYPGGGPAYTRNHGNELWAMLLEKAYAKLNGSYGALRSGR
jgi:calpain-15